MTDLIKVTYGTGEPTVSARDLYDLLSQEDGAKGTERFSKLKVQFKQGDTWVLYAKYQGNGYLKFKTHNYADFNGVQHAKEHAYWTQKGRLFLYDLLKQNDILPLMEN